MTSRILIFLCGRSSSDGRPFSFKRRTFQNSTISSRQATHLQALPLSRNFQFVILEHRSRDRLIRPKRVSMSIVRRRDDSSRSRVRSPETRASCERAKLASRDSRPGACERFKRTSIHRSADSRGTTVFAGANKGTRTPSLPKHQSAYAGEFGRESSLINVSPNDCLIDGGSRSKLAAKRTHLGQFVRLGF